MVSGEGSSSVTDSISSVSGELEDISVQEAIDQIKTSSSSLNVEKLWKVLESVVTKGNGSQLIQSGIIGFLVESLQVEDKSWNFDLNSASESARYTHPLRVLSSLQDASEELVSAATLHVNPNLPWTSQENSKLASTYISLVPQISIPTYIQKYLMPHLLAVSKSSFHPKISSTSGYKKSAGETNSNLGGLKPVLGFSSTSSEEEDLRRNWKHSNRVDSLSMVWYLIERIDSSDSEYWPLITSFILNVIEDHEPLFKTRGCQLLHLLVNQQASHSFLTRSGLIDLFIESTKVSLSYLPNLTPEPISVYLLSEAYPSITKLLSIKAQAKSTSLDSANLLFVSLVNENILQSIQHISGSSSHKLTNLLLSNIIQVVKYHLGANVIICLSRILFSVNQIIVNPSTLETADISIGLTSIKLGLLIHKCIIELFAEEDHEGKLALLQYKYDFLGAWSVLYLRLTKYIKDSEEKSHILSTTKNNVSILKEISASAGEIEAFQSDLDKMTATNRELLGLFSPAAID
ncbi:hypothetical protein CLIB1423_15S02256 [[Candida] railenensis]|uniref:Uncharacterized protein n=1 Tax=[Candida] railenensis TaxID=45579 RepID=A0A9P0QSS4_9ASCO|nr:hypothetical protein CLIB1423_15S02256 [[Candida] railenensis]